MTPRIDEIAPDLFRISLYVQGIRPAVQPFPGPRRRAAAVPHRDARHVPARARGGGESDRPGAAALDQLEPLRSGRMRRAQRVAGGGAAGHAGVRRHRRDDQHRRFLEPPAARACDPDEVLETGRHRFRFVPTPHLPHGWDAGVLFEETDRVLLCSDLLHQLGDVEPVTSVRHHRPVPSCGRAYQQSPVLMDYVPYTDNTRRQLAKLAALQPRTLAAMHGSTFVGDGAAIAPGERGHPPAASAARRRRSAEPDGVDGRRRAAVPCGG